MRRVLWLAAALAGVVLIGSGWYTFVEGFGPLNGVFQAVTTLSTVGFEEVEPLDTSGKVFTIVFIIGGIGLTFYTATTMIEQVVVVGLAERLRHDPRRGVRRMRDHVIVCGFGRVGEAITRELRVRDTDVVVVEQTSARLDSARELGCAAIEGDATTDGALLAAGIERARVLVAASDSDVGNTYIVLSARSLNPAVMIIARAGTEAAEARMRTAGANRVISPYRLAGRRMALTAVQPLLLDFVDRLSTQGGPTGGIIAEVLVAEGSPLAGRTLADAFGDDTVHVLGIERADGAFIVPRGSTTLEAGDRLMLFGPQEEVERVSSAAGASDAASAPRAPAPEAR